jgi:phi LC3 family holin
MKVNWKVRFKNKTWLTMFISLIVGFVFNLLKLFDIVPAFSENLVMNIVGQVLTFLGLIGVIVDPTTVGFDDSNRAMEYNEPWDDKNPQPVDPDPIPDPEEEDGR